MTILQRTPEVATLRHKSFPLEVKALQDNGTFEGYGSVFGVQDSYGEVVRAGAFLSSLASLERTGRTLSMVWQHRLSDPIGNWSSLAEDDRGLKANGELWLDVAPYAPLAYRGMKTKSITGLSIGFYTKAFEFDTETEIVTLTDVELVEISVVTSPANDDARVEAVKSKLERRELPTLSEFERFLRDAGFTKSQALGIATRGLKSVRSESEAPASDLAASLRNLSFTS